MPVRDAEARDHAKIRALLIVAFSGEVEADLVERLRAEGDVIAELVADEDSLIVGHILFSPMTAPFRALALAPVAVLPNRQRCGIGGELIRAGLDRARSEGCEVVFVLGEPAYYRRFGFDPALAAGFESPYAGPYLMALPLGGRLPVSTGTVSYAAAFAELT